MATAVDVAQVIYNKLGWVDAWKLEKLMLEAGEAYVLLPSMEPGLVRATSCLE